MKTRQVARVIACRIPGCGKEVTKHGSRSRRMCSAHNQRWLRGDRGERLRRPLRPYDPHAEKECSFDGCSKPVRARGLCTGHYNQRRKGKSLTPLDDRRLGRWDGMIRFGHRNSRCSPQEPCRECAIKNGTYRPGGLVGTRCGC